ncbi:MAG: DUF3320 domain-containing protein [Candidatus Didemnitutus sp.]|nr:DUF3320 domain-containing protein [Candidatus Didemnitutus sp.]
MSNSDHKLPFALRGDLAGEMGFHEPARCLRKDGTPYVTRVLEVEAPIHLDELVLRIRSGWGYERAGNRIHDLVAKAMRLTIGRTPFKIEEGFIVNSGKPAIPRKRDESHPPSLRKPEYIAPQEVRVAILVVIERHLGAQKDELASAVARLFGFKATSQQIRALIDAQIKRLLKAGILKEADGVLRRAATANPDTQLS